MSELPIFEMFYSLQGEGENSGTAAYFIRLAGCNVGCSFCDEKKAWNADNSTLMTVKDIVNEAKKSNAKIAVITGGEPTMYDLDELTQALHQEGIHTYLETSGVNRISGLWQWITLSPKRNKQPLPYSLQLADEIKIVIEKEEDFLFAEQIRQQKDNNISLITHYPSFFLQPEFSQKDKILPLIVEYIKQHPIWRLSLQTHKLINIK